MRRFILFWLACVVALVCAVVALNALVDPYGIVGAPRVAGFNAEKLAAADWPRVTKAYLVERAHPTTLVLGSSSADVGINPDSSVWPAHLRPVFNLAIDGGHFVNYLDWELHALATGTPKLLLVAISLEESLDLGTKGGDASGPAEAQDQFDYASRLRRTRDDKANPDYPAGRLNDAAFALLSLRALEDSLMTPLRQNDRWRTHQSALGWNSAGNFVRWLESEGSYSLVLDKDRDKAGLYADWSRRPRYSLEWLPRIIAAAQSRGVEVKLFILPNYADQMEIIRQLGLGPVFDRWKAEVAAIVDHAAHGVNAARAAVSLWDFSGYGTYTTEALPPPGDNVHGLRWFYEGIHFQPALGDLMVARMLGAADPANFGVLLTPATVESDVAVYHRRELEWMANHPKDVARVANVLAVARAAVCAKSPAGCGKVVVQ